uniref:Uncharacterized protein n=1 Tax=Caenorhabditis japonica TaxID=281687 RepID=A0A8R1I595_CAEJA
MFIWPAYFLLFTVVAGHKNSVFFPLYYASKISGTIGSGAERIHKNFADSSKFYNHPLSGNGITSRRDNFVRSSNDDEDLDLIRYYLHDSSFDKTNQLRYSSIPVIEKNLINEILKVIYKRKEYIRYLNNPKVHEMEVFVREMLRAPSQEVLKKQILHKILASRGYYAKYFQPMIEDNKRETLLAFADHLLAAHENGTLSTQDTVLLDEMMKNFAFFDRPDDTEFKQRVDRLQEVFGKSLNIKRAKTSEAWLRRRNTFVPDTKIDSSDSGEKIDNDNTENIEEVTKLSHENRAPSTPSILKIESSTTRSKITNNSVYSSTAISANSANITSSDTTSATSIAPERQLTLQKSNSKPTSSDLEDTELALA